MKLFSESEISKLSNQEFTEPIAKEIVKELTAHEDTRMDHYYWLNERENPEVISYLKEENDYLEKVLTPVKELREKLYSEMVSRIQQDDNSVPYNFNGYAYYTRHESGKEYEIYCRKKIEFSDSNEEIILDVNELAKDTKYCNVIPPRISPDNKMAVFAMDTTGRNLHYAFVKNLETNEIFEQQSPVVAGSFIWSPDSKGFFYDTKDQHTLRTDKIWLHLLGNKFNQDALVYEEFDETSYAHLSASKDLKYLFIHSGYTENVECHFILLDQYLSKPILFRKRELDFYYTVDYYNGNFFILTNDNAANFKLMVAKTETFAYSHWQELIPHNEDVLLEDLELFKNYLVLYERKDGLNQLHVIPWHDMNAGHYIQFRDASYNCWLGANKEFETDILRLHYTSLTTPKSTYDYWMPQRELKLLKENLVLGNFDKENYSSEYLQIKSRDGVLIPVSMVYKKGFKKDGKSPALLYAYGSYGIPVDASFSSNLLSLLDRGFLFAIAHVRGGKEKGWKWYEEGKMFKKMNSFHDFIDCAEFLIRDKYTTSDRLFGRGGSAGGLLMGVVFNLRPDLFKGLLAHVPFVDVVTTMSDPTIPLTTGEYTEWGNPNMKAEYECMKSYSPIDNITAKRYTNLLVTTGFSDSQVQYWEPAKWVAKIRKLRTHKDDLILFYTNLDAGHGGASGRFERLREIALEYSFMLGLLADYEN